SSTFLSSSELDLNPLAYRALIGINGVLAPNLAQSVQLQLIQNNAVISPSEYFLTEDNFDGINVRLKKELDRDGPTSSTQDDFVSVTYGLICTDTNGVQTTYQLTIFLDDINDNAPIFVNTPIIFSAPEGQTDVIVGTVSAVDADQAGNPNSQVTYFLDSLSDSDTFVVNLQSGVITARVPLDYEQQRQYLIPVVARDTARNRLSSTATVTVNVLDIQDNVPLFVRTNYVETVPENEANILVATVQATDADSVPNIEYILSGFEAQPFEVTPNGQIFTTANLDYEADTEYVFFVTTVDGQRSSLASASATITVSVLVSPMFVTVLLFKKMVLHCRISAHLVFQGSFDSELFYLFLSFQDRHDNNSPNIILSRSDFLFCLSFQDRNDNAPDLILSRTEITLEETAPVGSTLAVADATDGDPPNTLNSRIAFNIVNVSPQSGNELYIVDPNGGEIFLVKPFSTDTSKAERYEVTIAATDFGTPPLSGTAVLVINVLRNQQLPFFPLQDYSATIPQTLSIDSFVVEVEATDLDTQPPYNQLQYEMIGDGIAPNFFKLTNSLTPVVVVSRALTSDDDLTYTVRIVATDGGGASATATALITVNRNLNDPVFIAQNQTVNVVENFPLAISIASAPARDLDILAPHNQIDYTITGDILSLFYFSVDDSGVITLKRSLTDSTANQFVISIQAEDRGIPTTRTSPTNAFVFVNVQRNDFQPIFFNASYETTIPETVGTDFTVINVLASDSDVNSEFNQIRYKAIGDDTATDFFAVNPVSGTITTRQSLVLENFDYYNLRVVAADNGSPARSATVVVRINILRNFFAPVFVGDPYFGNVQETQPFGIDIVGVSATDADNQAPHNTVYYVLTGDTKALEFFQVNEVTGQVSVKKALTTDVDKTSPYRLLVEARDRGTPQLVSDSTALVLINVVRNQNAPEFINLPYVRSISESVQPGDSIFEVTATDADSQILVQALDSGVPPLSDLATVTIVVNRNLNTPVFVSTVYNVVILETQALGDTIETVRATDADIVSPNNVVSYKGVGTQIALQYFFINSVTGAVSVRSPLTQDNNIQYQLTVQAVDQGVPAPLIASPSAQVNITVIRNQFSPVFQNTPYQRTVLQGSNVGTSVFQVTATDDDLREPYNRVTYSIVTDETGSNFFSINPDTGVIFLQASIFNDVSSSYRVFVQAADGGNPVRSSYAVVTLDVNRNLATPFWVSPSAPSFTDSVTVLETIDFSRLIYVASASDTDVVVRKFYLLGSHSVMSRDMTFIFTLSDDGDIQPGYTDMNPYEEGLTVCINLIVRFVLDNYNVIKTRPFQAPYNQVSYSIVGEGKSPNYFTIDSDSGQIRLRSSLLQDTDVNYSILIRVEDKGANVAAQTATVIVNVLRNLNTPQFLSVPYARTVQENFPDGTSIFRATAVDADQQVSLLLFIKKYFPQSTICVAYRLLYSLSTWCYRLSLCFQKIMHFSSQGTFEQVSYEIIGDEAAPVFFDIEPGTGIVRVRQSLASASDSVYVRIRAFDNGQPVPRTNTTVLVVSILRNLNRPLIAPLLYQETIPDSTPLGTNITTIFASDADVAPPHNLIRFSARGSTAAATDFFFVDSVTGAVFVKQGLTLDNNQNSFYELFVTATDLGSPPLSSPEEATVQITVTRNRNTPQFFNTPFITTIPETETPGNTIFQVDVIDADVVVPFNQVTLTAIGDDSARNYFSINNAGEVQVISDLRSDTLSSYTLRLEAKDGGSPAASATALVTINVLRNLFAPEFVNTSYTARIFETQGLGSAILRVQAFDQDTRSPQNITRYSILDDGLNNQGEEYFFVDSVSGSVFLRSSLLNDPVKRTVYTFNVLATDLGTPPRSSQSVARVTINVIRNQNPPQFTNEPYGRNVNQTLAIGSSVFQVSTVDADNSAPYNVVNYDLIGDGDSQLFFGINSVSGLISLSQSIVSQRQEVYSLRVRARDGGSPRLSSTAVVTVTVNRNLNTPVFGRVSYETTIRETQAPGTVVQFGIPITASDNDLQVSCMLFDSRSTEIVSACSRAPFNSIEYFFVSSIDADRFFIDPDLGQIFVRRNLVGEAANQYNLTVAARDRATPSLTSQSIPVIINVVRNNNPPVFINEPYTATLQSSLNFGSQVTIVTATDADATAPFGEVSYSIIGDDSAVTFFSINSVTGRITVAQGFGSDSSAEYRIRVLAQDGGAPSKSDTTVVVVSVTRNLFPPEFQQTQLSASITENQAIGDPFTAVSCGDRDVAVSCCTLWYRIEKPPNNEVEYLLSGTDKVLQFFQVGRSSGQLSLLQPLYLDADDTLGYTLVVTCRDLGNPPLTAGNTATVTVGVSRNLNAPEFLNTPYNRTISSNTGSGTSIFQVSVLDRDSVSPYNQVSLQVIGDDSAPTFFTLGNDRIIRVSNVADLNANTLSFYRLRIVARDGGTPTLSAQTTVDINVRRNLFTPRFTTDLVIRLNIAETTAIGTSITQVQATDDDEFSPNNEVNYAAVGDGDAPDYFFVNPLTGEITLLQPILSIPFSGFVLRVEARDKGTPSLFALATVEIGILDSETLQFVQQNYATSISENLGVGQGVIRVVAQPGKCCKFISLTLTYFFLLSSQPDVTYKLTGLSDGPDYFNISETTGNIFVRTDLRTDLNRKAFYLVSKDFVALEYNNIVSHKNKILQEKETSLSIHRTKLVILCVMDCFSQLRVEASKLFSTGLKTAVSQVNITVIRNENPPVFNPDFYVTEVAESLSLGSAVVQLTATDRDVQDDLQYELVEEAGVTDFFYLAPNTGLISLKRLLEGQTTPQYEFQVRVTDSFVNPKFDLANVRVNVRRDVFAPVFVNTPYSTGVAYNTPVGTSIYRATAQDQDLEGFIIYEIIGYFAAPGYFNINPSTGDITVRALLNNDVSTNYLLGLRAYDSERPGQVATTNVTILVNRNPTAPVITNLLDSRRIPETFTLGIDILTVEATDADGNNVVYEIVNSDPADGTDFFFLNAESGKLSAARPLTETSTNTFTFTVAAFDDGIPSRRSVANAQITINIDRNQFNPVFFNTPYSVTIQESEGVGNSIIQVTARDDDQFGTAFSNVTYSLIGDDTMPSYFSLNIVSGAISVRRPLTSDSATGYQGRVVARDGGSPARSATAVVSITVIRNLFDPEFVRPSYEETILETRVIGSSILQVQATDSDSRSPFNTVRYEIQDVNNFNRNYFQVDSTTGVISIRAPLTGDLNRRSSYTFSVLARDIGDPVRVSPVPASVRINVQRNLNAPEFLNEPYSTSINFNAPPGSSVYTVSTRDVDSVVRVLAKDGGTPSLTATAVVNLFVARNLQDPEFLQQNYTFTIFETQSLGVSFSQINARDPDVTSPNNALSFSLIDDDFTREFFAVDEDNGFFFVKKSLALTSLNSFNGVVALQDNGVPPRLAARRAFVTINIIRNDFAPEFTSPSCDGDLSQNLGVGTSVTSVQATDADGTSGQFGQVIYDIIGDDSAPVYFNINQVTGVVTIATNLVQENIDTYQLRIRARDNGVPFKFSTKVCRLTITRNFQPPRFTEQTYSTAVLETVPLGDVLLAVTATDNDPLPPNNIVRYEITADAEDQACFLLNEITGQLLLRRSLLYDPCRASFFSMRVIARDQGLPQLSSFESNVTVTVFRNLQPPQFINTPYGVTLPEDEVQGRLVFTVTAIDNDNRDPFNVVSYSIIGDDSAPSVFNITSSSGQIRLTRSILLESETSYKIRVLAKDGGSPSLTATATVSVGVQRNLFSPTFTQLVYEETVLETQSLGVAIVTVSATDEDTKSPYNIVRYELAGTTNVQDFFAINSIDGTISARQSLIGLVGSNTYTFTVRAYDLGIPERQSLQFATVRINVIRNSNCPVFSNLPSTVNISQTLGSNVNIFNVTASDADPPGPYSTLTYSIIGDDNGPVYFRINRNTGEVFTQANLFTDNSASYRLRISATDQGGVQACDVNSILTIVVRRNEFAPVWTDQDLLYESTILETRSVLNPILRVQATDADVSFIFQNPNNVVNYAIPTGLNNIQNLFTINQITGDIFLRSSLIGSTQDRYEFQVSVFDNGNPTLFGPQATVVVNVIRNQNPPIFINEPYEAQLAQNAFIGVSVAQVTATDADTRAPYNSVIYDIIGDDSAPSYFSINSASGVISLAQSIAADPTDKYTIRVRAQDGGNPILSDITKVEVTVDRNLFSPLFRDTSYANQILETQAVGSAVGIRVEATDSDTTSPNNDVRYSLIGDTLDEFYFAIDPISGVITVKRSLADELNRNVSIFQFQALATDLGTPQRQSSPVDVTISVLRNQFPPEFINEPYNRVIQQNELGGSSVYQTTAIDRDTTSPFNSLTYELIGDGNTPAFFQVNTATGLLSLRINADIASDTGSIYVARVLAKDGGVPSRTATSTVSVNVIRNLFPPIYNNSQILQREIPETTTVGSFIARLFAFDADTTAPNNEVVYSIVGDDRASEFFFVNPNTGEITLLKSVQDVNINLFRIRVLAQDGGSPSRSDQTYVEVTVRRETGVLSFTLSSYTVQISENTNVNDFIVTTGAQPGNPTYRVLGFSPAPSYFGINGNSGVITLRSDLRQDPARLTFYQLLVEAQADTGLSIQTATAVVNITVLRNENGPVFTSVNYATSIQDTIPIGTFLVKVVASDADGDIIDYSIIDTVDTIYSDFVFLNPRTGDISTKISLLNTDLLRFQVRASDQRIPERTSISNVTISVRHDVFAPVFLNDPYFGSVAESSFNGTSVSRATATDQDLVGSLQYEVLPVGVAPAFFTINRNNGVVTLFDRSALLVDRATSYALSIIVYDSVYPNNRDTAQVTINVIRNPSGPAFSLPQYVTTIPDTFELGQSVLQVTAVDSDGDVVKYELVGDARALEYYYLNPDTGFISLKKPLTEGVQISDQLNLRARDQGVPEQFDVSVAIINIIRDQQLPRFTQLPYRVTVQRTVPVNSTVLRARAEDLDLQGEIRFGVIGNYPAPTFFDINEVTGNVIVTQTLGLDSVKTDTYFLSLIAFDSAYPSVQATATATISVNLNPNPPVFFPVSYERVVSEDLQIGSSIVDVNATDLDPFDVIKYRLIGDVEDNEFFFLNSDTGFISLKSPLTLSGSNQFRFSVEASDQSNPERTATSNVIVTVVRDESPPFFINTPYSASTLETAALGTTFYRVTASDADLRGTIRYEVTGDFQAEFYFNVDSVSGSVFVQEDLKQDLATSYTLRVIAYDDASPNRVATATVPIFVTRNPNAPTFVNGPYSTVIPETYNLGNLVIQVTGTDRDGDDLRYSLLSTGSLNSDKALDYFYIIEQTGAISLKRPLTDDVDQDTSFNFIVQVRDQRVNEKTADASVTVSVIRNRFLPNFVELPYRFGLSENTLVGSLVYEVTAVDQDLVVSDD
ncbi:protocadherin Fat 4, partial [Aplysia californica]|uniref:Protocadherin Fat 4 n=1 Tax=Aplysia californica TaxID=6500 RepID=A0ABM1VWP9_APLCA